METESATIVKQKEKTIPNRLVFRGEASHHHARVLSPEAISFLAKLFSRFESRRQELLRKRVERQRQLDSGALPDFLPETKEIRQSDWKVAPIPEDLQNRRVEITGPVDRKMLINALNSGANVYMADFEDSHTPTWENNLDGQLNLMDAVEGTITFKSPEGKLYELKPQIATLMVRPRGWHLPEKHVLFDDQPVSASLFDFGLFFFHNAKTLLKKGTGPYFYLPKLESHLEARLWNDVFHFAQQELGIPQGSIRATVLIENILAAFEMDEILYELRDHSAGLNCGRWDYIFSLIRKFRSRPDFLLPDRAQVTMTRHCMKSYVDLLIQTCHRRGIHAMGGMAAQIPIKHDPAANEAALEKVRQDKLREVKAGHDGTWVAHPGLVQIAKSIFDSHMSRSNQIDLKREDVQVTANDLLTIPDGTITEAGLHQNIDVGIQYLDSWLQGTGCVPLYNLMEDAATAEISRSQVWQWIRHQARLQDGRPITPELVRQMITQVNGGELASKLFEEMMLNPEYTEFLTLVAYDHID
jgi:malate synthase